MKTEAKIQQQIFIFYNNKYCLKGKDRHVIFSVPNESKSMSETLQKKRMGLISGVSDLIIVRPNEVLFVEVKTERGRQSKSQKKFEDAVTGLNHRYVLVRSLKDFINAIQ